MSCDTGVLLHGTGSCAAIELDAAARYAIHAPAIGPARGFELPRARITGAIGDGGWSARLRFSAVRSAAPGGYVGIDGEAFVPEIDLAELRRSVDPLHSEVALGLVEDPWVAISDEGFRAPALANAFATEAGLFGRSDLGGRVAFGMDPVAAVVYATSGEGFAQRERNEGVDIGALVLVDVGPVRFGALAREGSRGAGLARDHRIAARADLDVERFRAGIEAILAYGVDGDARRVTRGMSAYAEGRPGPMRITARGDLSNLAGPESNVATGHLGVGLQVPSARKDAPGTAWLGLSGTRMGPEAAAIAGSGLDHEIVAWAGAEVRLRRESAP